MIVFVIFHTPVVRDVLQISNASISINIWNFSDVKTLTLTLLHRAHNDV